MHELPRVTMLRQFRSAAHLGMAVARLIAAHPAEPAGEERYGYVTRDAQPLDEQARRDEATNTILAEIKAQQEREAEG